MSRKLSRKEPIERHPQPGVMQKKGVVRCGMCRFSQDAVPGYGRHDRSYGHDHRKREGWTYSGDRHSKEGFGWICPGCSSRRFSEPPERRALGRGDRRRVNRRE